MKMLLTCCVLVLWFLLRFLCVCGFVFVIVVFCLVLFCFEKEGIYFLGGKKRNICDISVRAIYSFLLASSRFYLKP